MEEREKRKQEIANFLKKGEIGLIYNPCMGAIYFEVGDDLSEEDKKALPDYEAQILNGLSATLFVVHALTVTEMKELGPLSDKISEYVDLTYELANKIADIEDSNE